MIVAFNKMVITLYIFPQSRTVSVFFPRAIVLPHHGSFTVRCGTRPNHAEGTAPAASRAALGSVGRADARSGIAAGPTDCLFPASFHPFFRTEPRFLSVVP